MTRVPALLVILCSSALVLSGCAGKTTTPTRYLLRTAQPGSGEAVGPARVGIGRVEVARYLEQPGLVLETGPNQVRAARQHRWAEPLQDGLRSLLRAELARVLGEEVSGDPSQRDRWKQVVDLRVDQLHGTLEGQALLSASWQLSPAGGNGSLHRFERQAPLAQAGYDGLVEAQIGLLRELAAAMAASLRGPLSQ